MPSYSTPASNALMETWYPLSGLWFSKIWAQMMRQISRRGADVGITCNWRSSVISGSAIAYPEDDFMLGSTGFLRETGDIYLGKMVDYLADICKASRTVACKRYFYAPSSNIPFATGEDGVKPMGFVKPLWGDHIQDRGGSYAGTYWRALFLNMRAVVDGLDRLKTMDPVPHPGVVSVLGANVWVYDAPYKVESNENVAWVEDGPCYGDGWRVERETAGVMTVPGSGTALTSGEILALGGISVGCDTELNYQATGSGPPFASVVMADVWAGSPDDDIIQWRVIRKATRTVTVGYDPTAWAAYKAAYNVDDTMVIPVRIVGARGSLLSRSPGGGGGGPTVVPDFLWTVKVNGAEVVNEEVVHVAFDLVGASFDIVVPMVGGSFTMEEVCEYDAAAMGSVNLLLNGPALLQGIEYQYAPDWAGFATLDDCDVRFSPRSGWGISASIGTEFTYSVPAGSEELDACDLAGS